MKIIFFKNETHFYPRVSYTWENAERVDVVSPLEKFYSAFSIAISIIYVLVFAWTIKAFSDGVSEVIINAAVLLTINVLFFPLHELCHVLFCVISRKRVERICFFPDSFSLKPGIMRGAYVKPAFGAFSKVQAALLSAFPLLLLTFVPLTIVLFVPQIKGYFIYITVLNVLMSSRDIFDVVNYLLLPKESVRFEDFALKQKDSSKPIVIDQMYVTPSFDKIHHKKYTYFNGKLEEQANVVETPETEQLRKEFAEQFGLKK